MPNCSRTSSGAVLWAVLLLVVVAWPSSGLAVQRVDSGDSRGHSAGIGSSLEAHAASWRFAATRWDDVTSQGIGLLRQGAQDVELEVGTWADRLAHLGLREQLPPIRASEPRSHRPRAPHPTGTMGNVVTQICVIILAMECVTLHVCLAMSRSADEMSGRRVGVSCNASDLL
mmetsp:Transcript_13107/g.46607  ORF Transcript_13107/g.46607 Transcript_13107/m.46607 type:complete len:172 (-) Transcript_13107:30-545(-)